MKEQSSTLENTNPKIVLPNKDLVGVKKSETKKKLQKKKQNYQNQQVGECLFCHLEWMKNKRRNLTWW